MGEIDSYLNNLVTKNKTQFSDFTKLRWLNPYQSEKFQAKRDAIINNLQNNLLFKDTKPFYNRLSKGCKLCGLGVWSCLFITGKCNAGCFYCPAPQLIDEPPSSQNLTFDTTDAYAEYINYFKFKGVSFSGGEPLLFFDRTLTYLKKIRRKCDPEIYIWMYTNGILASKEKFRKLALSGLNEIRFDIGATGYSLEKVKIAKGIIPNITIEIPAVPKEKEKIIKLLPDMVNAGVTNLNLHQLRLTKYNASKLQKENYTYIPAEQPIVLESELAALEIIEHAKKNGIDIGINYCSFYFKNRFQKAGFKKQVAHALSGPGEIITEKGFIREFNQKHIGYKTYSISNDTNNSSENSEYLKLKHKTYQISKGSVFKTEELDKKNQIKVKEMIHSEPLDIPKENPLFKIWQFEYIEKGLRNY